ncbi:hypothetical protein JCM8547_002905 [Rhodosporidiobolus lusitaniae]
MSSQRTTCLHPFLSNYLSPTIKSSCVKIGESAIWLILERFLHGLIFPFNMLGWLTSILLYLCLTLLEIAFYVSALVLLAATRSVISRESYRVFRAGKPIEGGSLRQFAKMQTLVDEYLSAHERACARHRLQPMIDLLKAIKRGSQADFFPRILRWRSDELPRFASHLEDAVTRVSGTDDEVECQKRLLRHVATFFRRHVYARPEQISPVQHPFQFLLHAPYSLAGILVKYIIPFPSLKHLEHSFHFAPPLSAAASDPALVDSLVAFVVLFAGRDLTLEHEDAKERILFECEAVAPDPTFEPLERRFQGAVLDAILDWKERKHEVDEKKEQRRMKQE